MCCASCGVARRSHCNTSIGRALAYEHDALHGGTIGFQQISPAVSPLEFRLRADLCAGESVTRQQAGRFRRAKNKPLARRGLAGSCSNLKFHVPRVEGC
jgi:hypothetical protein